MQRIHRSAAEHAIEGRLEGIVGVGATDLLVLVAGAQDPKARSAVDASLGAIRRVLADLRGRLTTIQTRCECAGVQLQIRCVLLELLRGISGCEVRPIVLLREENVMHFKVFALLARALRRLRSLLRIRVETQREVTQDELHLAGIDVVLLDLTVCLRVVAAAEGALVIREFNHGDRCIGLAEDRIIIDARRCFIRRRRRGNGRITGRSARCSCRNDRRGSGGDETSLHARRECVPDDDTEESHGDCKPRIRILSIHVEQGVSGEIILESPRDTKENF